MTQAHRTVTPRAAGSWRYRYAAMAVAALGLILSACDRAWPPYRYKLTINVDDNGVLCSGSSVVEVRSIDMKWIDGSVLTNEVTGQATNVHLRHDRVLLALLTGPGKYPSPSGEQQWYESATTPLVRLYNIDKPFEVPFTEDKYIKRLRGVNYLTTNFLPTMITFADKNNPATAINVDPEHLDAVFGPGVKLSSATLEVVDGPITTGITKEFRWLRPHQQNVRTKNDFCLASEVCIPSDSLYLGVN